MKVETPELDRRLDAMLTVLGRVETLLRNLVVPARHRPRPVPE